MLVVTSPPSSLAQIFHSYVPYNLVSSNLVSTQNHNVYLPLVRSDDDLVETVRLYT
jgi:hypothetical protein